MAEQRKKEPGRVKRWKQAIGHFIAWCLYGEQNPAERAQARQRRADVLRQVDPENERVRNRIRNYHGW